MNISTTLGNFVNKGRAAIAADKARKVDVDRRAARTMVVLALVAAAVLPELAIAGPWDTMGTQVLAIFTGGLTRTIAIITVIACGIAAMAGKLSWDWAIKIIVGIVLIFGAAAIVDYLIAAAS
jgi:type IV secretory pathway VirB2 component (pilin)